EEDQFAWLKELARVVKPGGVVAVSVNGATSLFNASYPPSVREALKTRGFCDTGIENTLKGVTSDDSYYRNIYHTHDYIRERWSEWFEILAILPAFVGNMQDMILLRPRR
ncbi:MAG: class I SAM-dependent methyltransferase, partial [Alphaproteobacteria bacterium]|nr:class I SAM-dependent methyltransferase [Alphaproteobacteria bacterium]